MSFSEHPNAEREWEVIRDAASSDLAKAHAFSHLALYHGNFKEEYDTAVRYAEQAEQLFQKCGDVRNVGDSLYHAGDNLFKMKKYTKALDRFQKAADIFRSEVDQIYLATCVDRMADCYSELNQSELAVQHYRDSARMFEVDEHWDRAGQERLFAAESLLDANEITEAEFEATEAIKHFDQAEETRFLPRTYNTRGRAFAAQNQHDLAIKDFDSAIALADYEEVDEISVIARYNKANCLLQLRQFDECLTEIRLARKAIKASETNFARAYVDLLEAKVCFEQRDFEKAEKLALKARAKISHTTKNETAEADHLLAEIEFTNGKLETAIERYEIAIESLKKLDQPEPKYYNVCVDFAMALLQTPQLQRAIEVLDMVPHVEFLEVKYQLASHNIRARAHYLMSQYERCFEVLEQVFALTGEDWESRDYSYAIETKARAMADCGHPDAINTVQYAVNVLTSQGIYEARYLAQQLREMTTATA